MPFWIDALLPSDWPAIRTIYQEGMDTGMATFETRAPEWTEWDSSHLPCCRLAARQEGRLLGWAALSPVSHRKAYAGVAEVSIYIAGEARGQGLGKRLLAELVVASEQAGIWTLQAVIFAENVASLKLHRAGGFRVVGQRERIAQRDGAWRDTIILERRSRQVGN